MPADLKNCMGPLWTPKVWGEINKDEYVNSNCYSYAFNFVEYGSEKLQPGEIHGTKYTSTSCTEIIKKMRNDYFGENIDDTTLKKELPKDRYKIALFIDPDKLRTGKNDRDQDYHFYRQDCDGSWSHKPGTNNAINEDASGDAITNPEEANKNYEQLCIREGGDDCKEEHDYSVFCGYFSVPLNSLYGPVTRYIERDDTK